MEQESQNNQQSVDVPKKGYNPARDDRPDEQLHANVSDIRKVKPVPSILQMEATECGAASLAMVMAHYGFWIPLEQMRVDCGVSRDGSKALNIIRAAREYGMTARGFRCQPKKLESLPLPMILFWEFNHFVVLKGIKKDKYYINDPATGPRVVTKQQFSKSFTGVVLAMQPSERFRKKRRTQRPSFWRDLSAYLKGNTKMLNFIFLLGFLLVFPGVITPIFSKLFIDDVLINQEEQWMRLLILGIIATAFFTALMTWILQRTLNRFQQKLSILFSSRFFWHLLRLPMSFFAQRYVGDINARVYACDRMAGLVSGQLASNGVNLFMVFFYGVVMLFYSVWMTVAVISLNLLNLLALKILKKVREQSLSRVEKEFRKMAGVSVSGVSIIETLKANGLEEEFFSKWAGYHGNMVVSQQQFAIWTNILNLLPTMTNTLTTIFILGLGSWQIIEGSLTVGGVIAFNMLAGSFSGPFTGLMQLSQNLQQAKIDMAQINDVMRHKRDYRYEEEEQRRDLAVEDRVDKAVAYSDSQTSGRLSGKVEIRNMTYGYNIKEEPLLKNLDLVVEPGHRIALVGSSGSGKSTIARLMVGLLQPWKGDVLYDGKHIQEVDPGILAQSIAFVDQDVILFQGTLRENITLWDNSLNDQVITNALRDADILEDVVQRPNRYDADISENGRNFSGGQRQRLEIARALACEPSVLVFDEATAALDPVTEKRIDEHIRRRGCTCVIVAHRLSTIRDADEIIVLRKGEIIERGEHEELIKNKDSFYYQLVTST